MPPVTRSSLTTFPDQLANLQEKVKQLEVEINTVFNSVTEIDGHVYTDKSPNPNQLSYNILRRKLYSKNELLRIELEEMLDNSSAERTENELLIIEQITKTLTELSTALRLKPISRPFSIFLYMEQIIRFFGVISCFIVMSTTASLPIMFLRSLEVLLQRDPFSYESERLKRFVAKGFLFLSGVEVNVIGLEKKFFTESVAVLAFTHASNMGEKRVVLIPEKSCFNGYNLLHGFIPRWFPSGLDLPYSSISIW